MEVYYRSQMERVCGEEEREWAWCESLSVCKCSADLVFVSNSYSHSLHCVTAVFCVYDRSVLLSVNLCHCGVLCALTAPAGGKIYSRTPLYTQAVNKITVTRYNIMQSNTTTPPQTSPKHDHRVEAACFRHSLYKNTKSHNKLVCITIAIECIRLCRFSPHCIM